MDRRFVYAFLFFCVFYFTRAAFAEAACECPILKCSPCEDQMNLTFYTKTCEGTSRLGSCSKPTCKVKDPAPAGCPTLGQQPLKEERQDESIVETAPRVKENKQVGVVFLSLGNNWIFRGEEKKPAHRGEKIFNTDTLETGESSKILIVFLDGNKITLTPKTKISIADYVPAQGASRKAWLDLAYGKLRSNVEQKYDAHGANTFKITTPVAVAGVRGTEFTVTHYPGAFTTKIETLTGSVRLSALKGSDYVEVPAKTQAAYIGAAREGKFAKFSKVEGLNEKQVRRIRDETDFMPEDEELLLSKSERVDICAKPAASFNQCAWFCTGNSPKSSSCRIDLPGVHCVRKRCNANGEWAEETRVPASRSQSCGVETKVGPCDY